MMLALPLLMSCISPLLSAEAANVQDSLVVGIQSTQTSLIRPLDPLERDMMSVYDLVYDSLVTIDDDYMPQPSLAESWEMTGNGKTWTFHLKEDMYFSNGQPLTASDVVATAEYILARANDDASENKGYYLNLKYFVDKISAPDEKTVVVKAERSYWGVLYAMTFPVLPANMVDQDNPPGTGPYYIDDFVPQSYISLKVNPHWWRNPPQVKEIMFLMADTANKVIENYEYARVDAIFTRSIAAAQYKSGTSNLAMDYRTNQLEVLLMNHSVTALSDINIRKAIRYLIDVDRIAATVYMGMVERTNTPAIPSSWMYNENLSDYFRPNVEEAKRLLSEAGYADTNDDGYLDKPDPDKPGQSKVFSLRIFLYEEPDNDVRVETANLISDALEAVGIKTSITTLTMADMAAKLKAGNFDLALVSYAMDVCPDYGFLLMSNNTGNYCRYRSTAMTDLCKELRTKTDHGSYQQTLHEIQRQFAEDCPFICLFYRGGTVLTRAMYTTARDVRELELLRGIELFTTE